MKDTLADLTKAYRNLNVHDEKTLDYLGMSFDYSVAKEVRISMDNMIREAVNEYSIQSKTCVLQALIHARSTPRSIDIQNTYSRYLGI